MCAHCYMSLLLDGEFWIKCRKFCLFQLFAQRSSAMLNEWLASFLADNHGVSKQLLFYQYSLLKENIFIGSVWYWNHMWFFVVVHLFIWLVLSINYQDHTRNINLYNSMSIPKQCYRNVMFTIFLLDLQHYRNRF